MTPATSVVEEDLDESANEESESKEKAASEKESTDRSLDEIIDAYTE